MTKSISSYPEAQQAAVIKRRLANKSGGSGYHAAVAAAEKLGIPVPTDRKFSARPPREREKREKKEFPRRPKASIKNFMRTR